MYSGLSLRDRLDNSFLNFYATASRQRFLMTHNWKEGLVLGFGAFLPFVLLGLGSVSLLDPDEGLYGSIAREMADSEDWITPRFNGIRYLEKPPLYFWLTAATTALFGSSEWAVRLWSALPALGTALLVWRLGKLLYGDRAGLLSAAIFLTSVGTIRYTHVAATDSLLIFSLTLSLYGFVMFSKGRASAAHYPWTSQLLFFGGMALGFLSKGLIGVVFPLLIAGLFMVANGRYPVNSERGSGSTTAKLLFAHRYTIGGLLFFLALVLPWHLLVAWKNPGFFEFYILDNQLLRFLNGRAFVEDDVPVTTVAFLFLTYIWFFPWSMFLLAAWRYGFPGLYRVDSSDKRLRLVVGLWALTVVAFFSLSGSKLEHYSLPAIPPLSLMVGAVWAETFRAPVSLPGVRWSLIAAVSGCSVVGVFLIVMSWSLTPQAVFAWLAEMNVYYRILKEQGMPFPFLSVAPFSSLARGLGAILVVGVSLSFLFFHRNHPRWSFIAVVGVAAGIAVLVSKLVRIIEPHHSAKSVALALNRQARPGEVIVHEGSLEYSGSLPFYTGRRIRVFNGKRGDLDFGSRYPEGRDLFLGDDAFFRLWAGRERVFLVSPFLKERGVVDKLSKKNVHFLGQYGSRLLYSNREP